MKPGSGLAENNEARGLQKKQRGRFDGYVVFVPEGHHDSSLARSAWNHEENSFVQRDD
jgi:hypothetical protein